MEVLSSLGPRVLDYRLVFPDVPPSDELGVKVKALDFPLDGEISDDVGDGAIPTGDVAGEDSRGIGREKLSQIVNPSMKLVKATHAGSFPPAKSRKDETHEGHSKKVMMKGGDCYGTPSVSLRKRDGGDLGADGVNDGPESGHFLGHLKGYEIGALFINVRFSRADRVPGGARGLVLEENEVLIGMLYRDGKTKMQKSKTKLLLARKKRCENTRVRCEIPLLRTLYTLLRDRGKGYLEIRTKQIR